MSGGIMSPDVSGKADTVMTTNGDTIYYNSGRQRLAKGSDDQVLTLASGLPSWVTGGSISPSDNITINGKTLQLQQWVFM